MNVMNVELRFNPSEGCYKNEFGIRAVKHITEDMIIIEIPSSMIKINPYKIKDAKVEALFTECFGYYPRTKVPLSEELHAISVLASVANDRTVQAVKLRHGYSGGSKYTYGRIALEMRITQERARQIVKRGYRKIASEYRKNKKLMESIFPYFPDYAAQLTGNLKTRKE